LVVSFGPLDQGSFVVVHLKIPFACSGDLLVHLLYRKSSKKDTDSGTQNSIF